MCIECIFMNCGIAAAETRGMLFVLSFSSVTQRQPGETELSVLIGVQELMKGLVNKHDFCTNP